MPEPKLTQEVFVHQAVTNPGCGGTGDGGSIGVKITDTRSIGGAGPDPFSAQITGPAQAANHAEVAAPHQRNAARSEDLAEKGSCRIRKVVGLMLVRVQLAALAAVWLCAGASEAQSSAWTARAVADRSSDRVTLDGSKPERRMTIDLPSMVRNALADAARRTGRPAAELTVISAEALIWPDGSLGCAQPGVAYTMAPVRGYRIRIEAAGSVLDYHASERGQLELCPAARGMLLPPASR